MQNIQHMNINAIDSGKFYTKVEKVLVTIGSLSI